MVIQVAIVVRDLEAAMAPLLSGSVGDRGASYSYLDGGPQLGGLIVETMQNAADGPGWSRATSSMPSARSQPQSNES